MFSSQIHIHQKQHRSNFTNKPRRTILFSQTSRQTTAKMHFSTTLLSTVLLLAASTAAAPTPDVMSCWSTCSLSCVQDGLLQGGLCDSAGTCTCLTGIQTRSPAPEPISQDQIDCYSSCSVGCVQSGLLQGGLCDAAGFCTCLTGVQTREAASEPEPISQDMMECYSSCSVGCVRDGNLQGGLCNASGACSCLTGVQTSNFEANVQPAASSPLVSCYSDCSVGCVKAGNLRGGMCSADG